MLKTHYAGDLRASDAGQHVSLAGWVHRRRDHGGLIFIDLRDSSGLMQVVFSPQEAPDAFKAAEDLRGEYVVQVEGKVTRRKNGTENPNLPTGEIEIHADALQILNAARTPPFYIAEEQDVEELLRLKYRYLDLRRERMRGNIVTRHKLVQFIRNYLSDRGFIEVETPVITAPTPEGSRDYIVPSRLHAGKFYALPQSPQQFKQLLMVAGFERYFQIAHCLRDEDLRADRQPEHTQLDLEMSFVSDVEDILRLMEALYVALVQEMVPHFRIQQHPFPRMSYAESMSRFGSDKPDMRYGMELVTFNEVLDDTDFQVFKSVIESGGVVRGFAVPGGAELSRKQVDALTPFAQQYGAKGLVWMQLGGTGDLSTLTEDDIKSPAARFFTPEQAARLARHTRANRGDMLLMVADKGAAANKVLDPLRRELAERLGLADPNVLAFCFVTDYPLLDWSETEGRWTAAHHPFTSPYLEDLPIMESDPGAVRSHAYDCVANGWELFSGSIRIHQREVQEAVFKLLGISAEEAKRRFGHMLEAFEYGAPPHAGIGAGIDRLMAVLMGEPDIREVIAFPKTKSAADPMTGAPATVSQEQLDELKIQVLATERDVESGAEA
ncbi:MAG TPA: aspartate--tRNA ligase [Dehalococcoidia bacterium]|nr:aspartate--tRNA ligase [Dehalococcoidia bacterium]